MHNRHPTTAPKRILIGVALVVLGLIIVLLILWSIDSNIIQPTFQHLEQQQAVDDSRRVQSAIENALAQITALANDWAVWDATLCLCRKWQQRLETNFFGQDPSTMISYL